MIVWTWKKAARKTTTKKAYKALVSIKNCFENKWWNVKLWKWNIPQKMKCFFLVCSGK